jgi:hypothetical protein
MCKLLVAGAVLAAACVVAPQFSRAAPNADVIAAARPAVAPSASVQNVAWVWVGGRRVWRGGPAVVVRPPVVVARPGVVVGAAPYTWGGRPYWHRRWYNGGWRYY